MNQAIIDHSINSKSLIGYAILAENIDSNNTSFLDNFLPLITQGVVDIQEQFTMVDLSLYIEKNFGLQFPIYVLEYSLKKLCRKNILRFDRTSQSYHLVKNEQINVISKRDAILNDHYILINSLKDYILSTFDVNHPNDQLEYMLELFLNISVNNITNSSTIEVTKKDQQSIYFVAKFLKYIEQHDPHLFGLYQKFYIGNMISSAMYFTQPDRFTQKFKQTAVYFDTTLIIYALGYAGVDRAQPVLQLIQLLRQQHAMLRCFSHTVDEVKGVLNSCLKKLENGTRDRFGTVEYFINKKYSASEIITLIHAVDKDIQEKLNIKVVEQPDYSDKTLYKYNIDITGYSNHIKKYITYTYEDSLTKDLDSINAIFRIRQGRFSNTVETSRAILVTNNNRLVNVVKDKFIADFGYPDCMPPLISDYVLATLQWIKSPNTDNELPKKMIISNCLVAMEPSEHMLQQYIDRIEKERAAGRITEEDFALLRTDSEARSLMMEKVKGDEDQIMYLNLQELAELTIQRKIDEREILINQQQMAIEKLQKEKENTLIDSQHKSVMLDDKNKEIAEILSSHTVNLKNRSNLIAAKTVNFSLLFIAVISSIWFAIAYNRISSESSLITRLIVQWIIPALGFLGIGVINFVKPLKAKWISSLASKIYTFFEKESR